MLALGVVSIIGVVQAKGGAGRSTVATNLAVGLSASKPTLLLDCDLPQGTSSSWFAARKARQTTDPLHLSTAGTHFELVRRVQELAQDQRYLVIDAPPRVTEVTRALWCSRTCAWCRRATAPRRSGRCRICWERWPRRASASQTSTRGSSGRATGPRRARRAT
jgi:hypothetical protein